MPARSLRSCLMLFTCVLATPLAMAAPAAAPAARLEPDDLAGPPLELAADVPQLGFVVPEVPDFHFVSVT